MTPADVAVVLGYLLAAAGAILGVWAVVVRPWRSELPDDEEPPDVAWEDSPDVTPGDPESQ